MTYDSWLTPSPLSGSGNGEIVNTATNHTGRVLRSTVVTVVPAEGDSKTYTVNQSPSPEFITVQNSYNVSKDSTSLEITGQSNTNKINWEKTTPGTLNPTIPQTYNVGEEVVNNNVEIPDDPGASNQFNFSNTITFTQNTTVSARTCTITLTAGAGGSGLVKTITITQAAGDATISLTPTSGTFTAAGSANTITVRSNTSWSSSNSSNTWLTVNIPSSTGDQSVSITAAAYTGRTQRAGSIVFTTTNGGTKTATYSATQSGATEFVRWASATYTASKSGGSVVMTGTSNSTKLTFSVAGGGTLTPTIPQTYTANSVSTNNGAVISGDPGASKQFNFSITITVPANLDVTEKTCNITVTPNSGTAQNAKLTQSAGDVTLSVTPSTITLPASGTQVGDEGTVNVVSNVSWTVS